MDERWMDEALREALAALDAGEVPVGAVVVKDGLVVGRAHNEVEGRGTATAHAELLAIGRASRRLEAARYVRIPTDLLRRSMPAPGGCFRS